MKILAINHAANSRVNRGLYRELAKFDGAEVYLIAPTEWATDFSPDKLKLQRDGKENFMLFGGKTFPNGKIYYYFFYSPLFLRMPEIKPDIVFFDEEPGSFSALQCTILARLFGAEPVFYTNENLKRALRFPLPLVEKLVFRLCKNAFAISDEGIEVLRKKGFKGRAEKLYLGVDTEEFTRRDASGLKEKLGLHGFVIGYMGRLIREKGVGILLEAGKELKFDFTIVIDGFGDSEYRKVLERRAGELGMGERVVFVNPDYGEMPLYLSALDVLVLPSRTTPHWKEQFGRVLVEAMACGVPVIGSDSGAIPDVIGEAGIVFREGNHKELAQKISELKNKKKLGEMLAEKGYKRAKKRFDWKRIAQDAMELFNEIMEERGGSNGRK